MLKPQSLVEGINPPPFTFGYPPAQSVTVDNFSKSYLYIVEAGLFIFPGSSRQIALPAPQSTVNAVWQAPNGVVNPTPTGGTANLQWSDSEAVTTTGSFNGSVVTEIAGTVVTQITPPVFLGTIAGSGVLSVALPVGCQGLLVTSSRTNPLNIIYASGDTSNQLYAAGLAPPVVFPVSRASDPTVSVSTLGPGLVFSIWAVFYSVQEPNQNPIATPDGTSYILSLQRPTFGIYAVQNLIAVAGTVLIPSPGVGYSIVLRRIQVSAASPPVAANLIRILSDPGGTSIFLQEFSPGTAAAPDQLSPPGMDYGDFIIGDNQGLKGFATAALGLNVMITYSVAQSNLWPTS